MYSSPLCLSQRGVASDAQDRVAAAEAAGQWLVDGEAAGQWLVDGEAAGQWLVDGEAAGQWLVDGEAAGCMRGLSSSDIDVDR